MKAHRYGLLEIDLHSSIDYPNPVTDCQAVVDFTGPSGQTLTIRAFWDGGCTWRVRVSPDEVGTWAWRTRCKAGNEESLAPVAGTFQCTEYQGDNPLYQHGSLKLSANGQALSHQDGTPFFWLADTAWNGAIRGDDDNWREYLTHRAEQRFSTIQFVASQWRSTPLDEAGEPCYTEDGDPISINPRFFQRLDRRVAMINAFGMIAAPVVLWSLTKEDPGYKLKEAAATQLASYIVSRYDAYQVVWLLGGDGDYRQIGIDRWKRIGRTVFAHGHHRLSTLHVCGQTWSAEDFRQEDWYDIASYQSGHGDCDDHLRWLVEGPPATTWDNSPRLPTINMEPNYETAFGFNHRTVFTDYHTRRAVYWSLLVSPTAGITYGHDSIWNWNFETGPSIGHGDWHDGAVPPWHTGLETPGIRSMTIARNIFEQLKWATLTPCQSVLAQPFPCQDPKSFIAAGQTASGTTVIYAPLGNTIDLAPYANIAGPLHIVNPRTGESTQASESVGSQIIFPDNQDWLAICGKEWPQTQNGIAAMTTAT